MRAKINNNANRYGVSRIGNNDFRANTKVYKKKKITVDKGLNAEICSYQTVQKYQNDAGRALR